MKLFDDLSTKAFYALLIGVSVFIMAMPFSTEIQRLMINRFHYRDASFVRWGVLQIVPSMYNFSNTIELQPGGSKMQVNHFPLRPAIFNPDVRKAFAQNQIPYQITLISRYRETEIITIYRLNVDDKTLIFDYEY